MEEREREREVELWRWIDSFFLLLLLPELTGNSNEGLMRDACEGIKSECQFGRDPLVSIISRVADCFLSPSPLNALSDSDRRQWAELQGKM